MRRYIQNATLFVLALLPTTTFAEDYTATPVSIIDPKTTNVPVLISTVVNWILGISGALGVLFLVWGGIQYVTSSGNEEKVKTARQTITNAVVGLIVIVLAKVIVSLVVGLPADIKIVN